MSVAVICIVIAGIMVPGIVLEANQKSEHDHVAKVPKKLSAFRFCNGKGKHLPI